jgi:hypothetical protein
MTMADDTPSSPPLTADEGAELLKAIALLRRELAEAVALLKQQP